ncbi:glycoside hydrolase family 43 protein [Fulvivirga sediminis]|uniref:Glycoside hydrolase family 43 protein n=1 Tax=Fulvivirga sediminis TaxID=2803949 RepID=A0A937F915_9BACT|nr:glycoside hydrolase family 43 protein [Fulvivirga sediminis]MBL3656509.1 glycoside hydrolase family 43 protein [Fulvivirga sediminis]
MMLLRKHLTILFICILCYSCTENEILEEPKATPEDFQSNNVSPSGFIELGGNTVSHDPCLIKEPNGLWWAFMTGTGVGVKYSSDGVNWTQGVQVFPNELSWWRNYAPNMGRNDVWAPDCFYHNGRYWLYYSVSEFGKNNSAIGLTSCSSIVRGDWRDDGVVVSTSRGNNAANAIDPNIIRDASNNLWMVYGSWFDGIRLVRLNSSTMKPTGTHYAIARRGGGIENTDIVYNNGYYYLFVSLGVCCNGVNSTYRIAYGRSTNITGPYYDKNGVNMLNGGATILDAGNVRWKGPGAPDIYNNNGNYLLIRHAYDAQQNGTPKMLISDLFFVNGWPTY